MFIPQKRFALVITNNLSRCCERLKTPQKESDTMTWRGSPNRLYQSHRITNVPFKQVRVTKRITKDVLRPGIRYRISTNDLLTISS